MKKNLLIISLMLSGIIANAQNYSWLQQAVPYASQGFFFDVEAVDSNVVWATPYLITGTTQNPTKDFARTIDGGTTWTYNTMNITPATLRISNIWPMSATKCYVSMYNSGAGVDKGGVYVTTDGGLTWNKQTTAVFTGADAFPDMVCFFNDSDGVVVGDPNPATAGYLQIYTTTDGGTNWTAVPQANIPQTSGDYGIVNLFSHFGDNIWIGTAQGDVVRSSDKGYTWTKSSTGLPVQQQSMQDITFCDALHGLVSTTDTIYGTSDGGATWSNITYTGRYLISDMDAIPGTTRFISSGSNTTFGFGTTYSDDFGATWIDIDTLRSQMAIDFVDSLTGWTGEFVQPTGADGAHRFFAYTAVACGDPLITAGVATTTDSILCGGDTAIVTTTGLYVPTTGPIAGVSWILTTSDVSNTTDPMNEPTLKASYPISFYPSPFTTNSAFFINDGTIIGSTPTLPYGVYYWTPVVFGNALPNNNPISSLYDVLLDAACTHGGNSVLVDVKDPSDPYCILLAGIHSLSSENLLSVKAVVNSESFMDLQINAHIYDQSNVEIFDLMGRNVFSQKYYVTKGVNHEQINISNLTGGTYVVQVSTGYSKAVTKIVKL